MDLETFEQFFFIRHVKNWFVHFERLISSFSLVGGFIFDIFALKRIDEFLDNFWIGFHLVFAAVGIILLNLFEKKKRGRKLSERAKSVIHFWLIVLVQFAFGGLLSAFLVFYFRSATLAASWPFFVLLAVAFIGNEAFKHQYSRLGYQISIFFLSLYSYAIYVVPVALHRVGDDVFLLAGAISVCILMLFLALLRKVTHEEFKRNRAVIALVVAGSLAAINVMYFTNIIPPIPLSLKDAGVFHSIVKKPDHTYSIEFEAQSSWFRYFSSSETVNLVPGDSLYVFSAVFSPTNLNTTIFHVWQHYDDAQKKWLTTARIPLPIVGGRDEGYRTYSVRNNILAGKWRVNVETESGQILGRIRFDVLPALHEPALTQGVR